VRWTATSAYDGSGSRSPRWWPSRYGAEDRIGAGNELMPERTLAALNLPASGEVVELAQHLDQGSPAFPPRSFRQLILAHGTDPAIVEPSDNDVMWLEEQIVAPAQIGCHVDGLGHLGVAGHFYNGLHYSDFYSPTGLTELGSETLPSWVCRGVMLDVAALLGTACLPAGFVIGPAHLEAACEKAGVEPMPGDAVLVRTGWSPLWRADPARYHVEEPGVGWAGAHWLTERRPSIVGADNWSFEPIPFEDPGRPFVVHQHLLAETGTYILENITLEALHEREAGAFLFVLSTPRIRGATAGLASPLAVL
jgi:kynurenine formamidase